VVIKETGKRREVHTETHAYDGTSTSSSNYKSPESITKVPFTCFPFTFALQYCDMERCILVKCCTNAEY
jgi:hypothetical protein